MKLVIIKSKLANLLTPKRMIVTQSQFEKSFSGDLAKKYPDAHWVTLQNGTHVMIRTGGDGKSRVVFSGNANLEHMEFKDQPQSSDEKSEAPKRDEKYQSAEELQKFNKYRKEKIEQNNTLKNRFVDKLTDITGVDFNEKPKKTGKKEIDDLNEEISKLGKKDKEKVKKAIENIATSKATNGLLEETVGHTYADLFGESALKTGIAKVDEKLESLLMSPTEAIAILNASQQYLSQQKDLEKAFKTVMKKPEEFIETISNLSEVGVKDAFSESQVVNEALNDLLEKKAVQDRIEKNMTFYDLVDNKQNKESLKLHNEAVTDTLNTVLQLAESDLKISRELVNLIGSTNAAKLIAHTLDAEQFGLFKEITKVKSEKLVEKTIEKVNKTLENLKSLQEKTDEGTLYAATFNLQRMKAGREMAKDVNVAAGSLNASAELYNAYNQKGEFITLDIPSENLNDFLTKIDAKDVRLQTEGDITKVILNKENIGNILSKQRAKAGRDEFVNKMKNHELVENDYKPAFANATALPSQQEGIKWAIHQKRTILDFEAGLGKTYTYLGIVGELKQAGKLKDSFALMAVPSTLKMQLKGKTGDAAKYFPDLKILDIDEIGSGMSLKKRKEMFPNIAEGLLKEANGTQLKSFALDAAKRGEYDIVLSGHDSLKQPETVKLFEANQPAAFIVDEAHQTVSSDSGEDMMRYSTVKKLAKNAEYFTAGTGTLVKNHLGEFAKLLNIAKPDQFVNPKSYADKWNATLGKDTKMFSENTINNFRKTFDDVVLTRASDIGKKDAEGNYVSPKKIKNTINVELSKPQKNRYKAIENQYKEEKLNKGKLGILNKATGMLETLEGGQLATFNKKKDISGYNSKTHSVIEIGGQDSANRRDLLHRKNLYGGDWKENAKISSIMDNIKNSDPKDKHLIYYDTMSTQYSKPALISALMESQGLRADQIAVIDGSIPIGAKRDAEVAKFQNDPNIKFMIFNSAGATGLNLQAADKIHVLTRPNNYAEQQQLEARAFRKGRLKDVNINYYDTDTYFDKQKVDKIKRSRNTTKQLGEFDNNPTMRKTFNNMNKENK